MINKIKYKLVKILYYFKMNKRYFLFRNSKTLCRKENTTWDMVEINVLSVEVRILVMISGTRKMFVENVDTIFNS